MSETAEETARRIVYNSLSLKEIVKHVVDALHAERAAADSRVAKAQEEMRERAAKVVDEHAKRLMLAVEDAASQGAKRVASVIRALPLAEASS